MRRSPRCVPAPLRRSTVRRRRESRSAPVPPRRFIVGSRRAPRARSHDAGSHRRELRFRIPHPLRELLLRGSAPEASSPHEPITPPRRTNRRCSRRLQRHALTTPTMLAGVTSRHRRGAHRSRCNVHTYALAANNGKTIASLHFRRGGPSGPMDIC